MSGGCKGGDPSNSSEIPTEVLGLYFYENSPDPARLREWEDVRQCLSALVKRLPKQQAQIIQMHYGLDGYVPHSQPEIANLFWGHQAAHQSIGNSCAGVAATACPQPLLRIDPPVHTGLDRAGQQTAQLLAVGRLSQPHQRSYFQLTDALLGDPKTGWRSRAGCVEHIHPNHNASG